MNMQISTLIVGYLSKVYVTKGGCGGDGGGRVIVHVLVYVVVHDGSKAS